MPENKPPEFSFLKCDQCGSVVPPGGVNSEELLEEVARLRKRVSEQNEIVARQHNDLREFQHRLSNMMLMLNDKKLGLDGNK